MRLAPALLVVALAGVVRPVAAEPASADADRAFREGVTLFSAARYREALEAFERARALRETAAVLRNIGACFFELAREAEALNAYERYLAVRGDPADARGRAEVAEVRRQVQELRGHVAYLTVVTNVEHPLIVVNGVAVQTQPTAVDVEQRIAVRVEQPGCQPVEAVGRATRPEPFRLRVVLTCGGAPEGATAEGAAVPSLVLRVTPRLPHAVTPPSRGRPPPVSSPAPRPRQYRQHLEVERPPDHDGSGSAVPWLLGAGAAIAVGTVVIVLVAGGAN